MYVLFGYVDFLRVLYFYKENLVSSRRKIGILIFIMENHSRTIIHIDIDCFYAQVEMVQDPSLKDKPLGIQQKNIVVTSNYVAREYGIKKCMLIAEAKKLCPNLVLVKGEDLYNYRQVSYKVTGILQKYSEIVERLGLDENFIDVTDLVNRKLKSSNNTNPVGYTFGEADVLCDCGCTERISVGSQIANEIRNRIYEELCLTVCAGIAHNKLLAKIVGSKNKPNKQTLVFPNNASELILSLEFVRNIPWIGSVSAEQLTTIKINTVTELQNSSIEQLKNLFGPEKAKYMWNCSFGTDNTPVKKTGKPQSIGLEDSCKALTSETEVEDKLKCLLKRLMILVKEDGRIPKTVKLTIRKLDHLQSQAATRETKQCNINTSIENEEKIINIVMPLFRKAVDVKKKFGITLLGISFTKFTEKSNMKNTLTNFLSRDEGIPLDLETTYQKLMPKPSTSLSTNQNYKSSEHSSNCNMPQNQTLQYSESQLKPNDASQRLNSSDTKLNQKIIVCPPHVNEEVFKELPIDLQEELWTDYKRKRDIDDNQRSCKKVKVTSILNYIVRGQKKKI